MFQRENDFMKQFSCEAEQIMMERFGKDTIISLATTENATPYVRYVNAYYENGSFYIITHALSNKTYKSESCCSNRRRVVYSTWERRQPGLFRKKGELCDC